MNGHGHFRLRIQNHPWIASPLAHPPEHLRQRPSPLVVLAVLAAPRIASAHPPFLKRTKPQPPTVCPTIWASQGSLLGTAYGPGRVARSCSNFGNEDLPATKRHILQKPANRRQIVPRAGKRDLNLGTHQLPLHRAYTHCKRSAF